MSLPGSDALLRKLAGAKKGLTALDKAVLRAGLVVAGQAQRNVSGPRPEKLGVVTGRLRQSISAVSVGFGRVKVGTNVSYARIHEFGGKTAPHDIYPRRARALHFTIGGQEIFARVVHHPGSNIPARPYLRPALIAKRPQILRIIRAVYAGPLHLGGERVA